MIGALSVIGLPPLADSSASGTLPWALDRDAMWVVVVLLISSLLNVFYLLPVAVTAFFRTSETDKDPHLRKHPGLVCFPF